MKRSKWFGTNNKMEDYYYGISENEGKYRLKQYEHFSNVPKGVILPEPQHNSTETVVFQSVNIPRKNIEFRWRASIGYNDYHTLEIYFNKVLIERVQRASPEVALSAIRTFRKITDVKIYRKQVDFLSKELEATKMELASIKVALKMGNIIKPISG